MKEKVNIVDTEEIAKWQQWINEHSPKSQNRFLGEDCIFHLDGECLYSHFVKRNCKEGCCPDLDQYCDDAEVRHDRLEAVAKGELGQEGPLNDFIKIVDRHLPKEKE